MLSDYDKSIVKWYNEKYETDPEVREWFDNQSQLMANQIDKWIVDKILMGLNNGIDTPGN